MKFKKIEGIISRKNKSLHFIWFAYLVLLDGGLLLRETFSIFSETKDGAISENSNSIPVFTSTCNQPLTFKN